jgi:hypothetical protein
MEPLLSELQMVKEVGKDFRFTIVLIENERNIVAGNMSASLEFFHEFTPDLEGEKEIPLQAFT